jgi:hypothetical protein
MYEEKRVFYKDVILVDSFDVFFLFRSYQKYRYVNENKIQKLSSATNERMKRTEKCSYCFYMTRKMIECKVISSKYFTCVWLVDQLPFLSNSFSFSTDKNEF